MNSKFYLLGIALVCMAIFFPHLSVVEVNIMEARNFITAREMLEYGNWIHTTMNLEPRYEKPPLPTWLTAFSAAVFGLKNFPFYESLKAKTIPLYPDFYSFSNDRKQE